MFDIGSLFEEFIENDKFDLFWEVLVYQIISYLVCL